MMAFYKRILCVFIVLYINLSSSYFIKVQPRSKKQEVDLFIQKLLDSDKFDEFADKIAMKAVQRINNYNDKEAHKKLRSAMDLEETHRSAANKKREQESLIDNAQFSTRALTSDEKKTTIISLKYKRFTKNILNEEAHYSSKNATTKGAEQEEEFTNKDETESTTKNLAKMEVNNKFSSNETRGALRNKALNDGDSDDDDELTTKKEPSSTKKTTTKKSKFDDDAFKTNKEISSTKTSTTKAKDDGDTDDEFVTKKETTGTQKSTQRLGDDDDDDDDDNDDVMNKFGANEHKQNSPRKDDDNDFDLANKEANGSHKNDDYDSDDEIVRRTKQDDEKKKNKRAQKEVKKADGSFDASEDVKKLQHSKNKHNKRKNTEKNKKSKKDIKSKKDNYLRIETENQMTKDTGDADPEEKIEIDSNESTEERLGNNKILVRREGNTLYAQNLGEYDDYRAQLEHAAGGTKDVAPF